MILEYSSFGPFETNAYIIACPNTRLAALIDAPMGCKSWVEGILDRHNLKLMAIWLTHSHWDHIFDAKIIKEAFSCEIYIHKEDQENLEYPGTDKLPMFYPFKGAHPDRLLKEGMLLKLGELEAKVIETPGHTPGGVCFYMEKEKILFSGDTLFRGTIGNLSFPTARPDSMWNSLKKLALLPLETKVFPGHGEFTTIQKENWLKDAEEIFG